MFRSAIIDKFMQIPFMKKFLEEHDVVVSYLGGSHLAHLEDEFSDYDLLFLVNDDSAYCTMHPVKFLVDGMFVHPFFNSLRWFTAREGEPDRHYFQWCSSLVKWFDFSEDICVYINDKHKELVSRFIEHRRLIATYGSYLFHNHVGKFFLSFCEGRGKLIKTTCTYILAYYKLSGKPVDYAFLKKLHREFTEEYLADAGWKNEVYKSLLEAYEWFEAHKIDIVKLEERIVKELYGK